MGGKIETGYRWDGLLSFRYKLVTGNMQPLAAGWKVQIYHANVLVVDHTFGSTRDEYCSCPESYADFKEIYKCPAQFEMLQRDFEPFKIIDLDQLAKAGELGRNGGFYNEAAVHYIIKDQKLYRKSLGTIDGFKSFSDTILHAMLRKVKLPDIEFVFDLGDWPVSKSKTNPLPIFSWCGSTSSFDIIVPTWDQIKHMYMGMGRARGDITLMIQESGKNPTWGEKIPKAFFRGRDSNESRMKAAEMSQKHPDLIDAGLTLTQYRKHDEAKWGPKAQYKSLATHSEFKYQLLLDGTVAAFRAPGLFVQDALIMKQDSGELFHFLA